MEPIGLAVSLVGLFDTAVDCFRYVKVAKAFGTDFQTTVLQLDNAQLRLSRWGVAVGLGPGRTTTLASTSIPAHDVEHAERLLGQIGNVFRQAEDTSKQYRVRHGSQDVVEFDALLAPEGLQLHKRMLSICDQRRNNTSLGKKIKWAIYKKDHFRGLANDIEKLVQDLVELFPATQQVQRKLCDQEAAILRDSGALSTLLDIAKASDIPLAEAIARLAEQNVRFLPQLQSPQLTVSQATPTRGMIYNYDNTKVMNQVNGHQNIGSQTIS
ncbi:hypothetical protein LTR27_002240 [Elasticomyces elasticus]|nr:hypothetical protein LTR27_002240 [Elasticomyces elasticus]